MNPRKDWNEIKLAYVNSIKPLRVIAEEFGVGLSACCKHCANGGWDEERKLIAAKVEKAAQDAMCNDRAATLARFNEADVAVARAVRERAANMLLSAENPVELRALASALESAQKIGRLALGATTGNTGMSNPAGGAVQVETLMVDGMSDADLAQLREMAIRAEKNSCKNN